MHGAQVDASSTASSFSDDFILNILSTLSKSTKSKSVKLFSHGRGLAAHLHAVHTPWKPGKAELKRRKALQKRMENEQRRLQRLSNKQADDSTNSTVEDEGERCTKRPKLSHEEGTSQNNAKRKDKWEPTEEEINQWNQRVMEIVSLVESEAKDKENAAQNDGEDAARSAKNNNNSTEKTTDETKGRDRSGNVCLSYRQSLPPFLAGAADGDLKALQQCANIDKNGSHTIQHGDMKSESQSLDPNRREHIKSQLSLLDRNGSSAEHWAAGGGHLDCVSFLLELRDLVYRESKDSTDMATNNEPCGKPQHANKKVRRRRDGKTSLHYAARNGHNNIIDLVLSRHDAPPVDIPSGDGTSPLQMACYGGHPSTVKHLVEKHHANIFALNEWECGSSHWAAMSIGREGSDKVIELCEYLKTSGVNFAARQKQGHTPLHKASQRKNRHVIEWLANPSNFSEEERKSMGLRDVGGNRPSDIWLNVGGENEFGLWMKDECGW